MRNTCTSRQKSDKKGSNTRKFEKLVENNYVKGLYNTTKEDLGWSGGNPTALQIEGKLITKPQDIVVSQMKFFRSKVDKLIEKMQQNNDDPLKTLKETFEKWGTKADNRPSFELLEVNMTEVIEVLKELSNNTLYGHNRLDSYSIKLVASHLAAPLRHIINLSIREKMFCNRWKFGRLIPLHKGKGLSTTNPKNYRPISLLPIVGKITEKLVQKQMLNFMESMRQINHSSHAYRRLHSTTTVMLQIADDIQQSADDKLISCLMMVDESSAFDCVNHITLENKFRMYNFSEDIITWFRSYLSFCSKFVSIGAINSHIEPVKHGVPQGSVLRPLIYTIYTNKLAEITKDKENCPKQVHQNDKDNLFGSSCVNCRATNNLCR